MKVGRNASRAHRKEVVGVENRIGNLVWTPEKHAEQACVYISHAEVEDEDGNLDRAAQLATIGIGHALTALAMLGVDASWMFTVTDTGLRPADDVEPVAGE